MGDVNADFLSKNNNTELKSVFQLYGFKLLIEKPARIDGEGKSLIDIIVTNHAVKKRKTDVIPVGISDHEMIGSDWTYPKAKIVMEISFDIDGKVSIPHNAV